jgi:hypothetical protein
MVFQSGGDPKETTKEAAGEGQSRPNTSYRVLPNYFTCSPVQPACQDGKWAFSTYPRSLLPNIATVTTHSPDIAMDLADIQDWTKETLGPRPASYHRTAIDALAMILNGSESPTAVAVIITAAYSSSADQTFKTGDGERIDIVKVFWRILCDAARMFGSAHSRLIDLLQEMSTQPDMCATDGSFPKTPAGMVFWRDLPGFPFHLSDDALC